MSNSDFSVYQSPLSHRYSSTQMRQLYSEENKYRIWRQIWVALAAAEHRAGLVTDEELADLREHQDKIDIARIEAIEQETKHDVVAAIREFAEKAPLGGKKIHLGATSMDINDNADAIRTKQALELIEAKLRQTLAAFGTKIGQQADTACMGYTHLQAAEPTTIGYRLGFYASDLLVDYEQLKFVQQSFKAKGMKGAVGTRASYAAILAGSPVSAQQLDEEVMGSLGISGALVTSQVVSRKHEYQVLCLLASIGSSLAKFAGDLRILQSAGFGEWSEPFGTKQVGSSAMPFKRNPINSEKICSLARYLTQLPAVGLENASLSYLERTLDDSANRRLLLPEAFLITDEILLTAIKLIEGLQFNEPAIERNLANYAPFSATESLIIEAVKQGADRQTVHELMREIAMEAWQSDNAGSTMTKLLQENSELAKFIPGARLAELLDVSNHLGDAPERARKIVTDIKRVVKL